MIFDQTGLALSHVTLNTIVQFLEYGSWREFRVKNTSGPLAKDASEGGYLIEFHRLN